MSEYTVKILVPDLTLSVMAHFEKWKKCRVSGNIYLDILWYVLNICQRGWECLHNKC